MTKFLSGIIITLSLTLTFFIYKHNKTLQDLEHEKNKNLSLESKLQDSNNALEKIKLDTQSYNKQRDKEIQAIQDKYTAILQEHERKSQNMQKEYQNKLETLQKSVVKENLTTQNKNIVSHQYDNKFFTYSEIPNNSNLQNESILNTKQKSLNQDSKHHNTNYNTILYELQQCEAQIQTAKDMLQAF